MDAFSKWPEVHMMESTTTELLIKYLQQIFAVHGIPHQVVSDNCPQFVAEKFQHYCMSAIAGHWLTKDSLGVPRITGSNVCTVCTDINNFCPNKGLFLKQTNKCAKTDLWVCTNISMNP